MHAQPISGRWDAGGMGCGELVMQLRLKLRPLSPGDLFELIATDEGASEDIPAWCRLTGHALVEARAPRFLIRRKDT